MKRFVLIGVVCLVIGAAIGYYAGRSKEAAPVTPVVPETPVATEPSVTPETKVPLDAGTLEEKEMCAGIMKFHSVSELQEAVRNSNLAANTAYAVDRAWLLASIEKLADKTCVHFIVQELIDKDWKVMDPDRYRIFVEGYDESGQYGALEDFPPVVWPVD